MNRLLSIILIDYLDGRTAYLGGEYIGAIEKLESARINHDPSDVEFYSEILNTSASVFTDNLFFEQADFLIGKAERIRADLHLPALYESVSGRGVCAFKAGRFKDARNLFEQAYQGMQESGPIADHNRILNYIAKAQLFCGEPAAASVSLDKALESADTAKKASFSHAIRMALLVSGKKHQEATRLFRSEFMLPENHEQFDVFALGWGYRYQAEACAATGLSRDAAEYLARAIRFFDSELYVLEACSALLLPIAWGLDPQTLSLFSSMVGDMALMQKLEAYCMKHRAINQSYFKDVFTESGASLPRKARLENFGLDVAMLLSVPDKSRAQAFLSAPCLL